ncbi:MAG: YjbQ family protein, partial [Candidatus Acidiferrales bacterium]
MKIYTDVMTFQTEKKREFLNITPQVKAALEKSGFRDGFILVSVTHSNAAIIVSDDEPGLLEDLQSWIEQV